MTFVNNNIAAAAAAAPNAPLNVKLEYNGELRRFSTPGTSYKTLVDEVIAILGLEKDKELVLRYRDEEEDLILMSSDLELKSAVQSGRLLRLFAAAKGAPAAPVSQPKALPEPVYYPQVEQAPFVPVPVGAVPFVPPHPGFSAPPSPGFPAPPPAHQPGFPAPSPHEMWGGRRGGYGRRGGFGHPHPPHSGAEHGPYEGHHGPYGGRGHHGRGHGKWAKHEDAAWMANSEAMVTQIMSMGFDVKKEKVFKLLKKFDGNADEVTRLLVWKKEKRAWKQAKREAKQADKLADKMDVTKMQ